MRKDKYEKQVDLLKLDRIRQEPIWIPPDISLDCLAIWDSIQNIAKKLGLAEENWDELI